MLSANTVLIKEVNKALMRAEFMQLRNATVHQLSRKTGLSVVTVSSLLSEMQETGEVLIGSAIPSNGGRPSILYTYNENFRQAVVIYGCQKNNSNLIHFLIVNLYGECLARQEAYVPEVEIGGFSAYIDEAVQKFPAIGAIGFGLPGPEEDGVILGGDYKKLIGGEFMRFYRERYGLPVAFINDVNAAVSGFYKEHANLRCVAGLYFPRIYRVGAGILMNGKIHTGFRSFAGELACMPSQTDWLGLDYTDRAAVTEAVGKLLATYCCIVAPEQFVLYGDFFEIGSAEEIQTYTQSLVPPYFRVSVCVSGSFEKDFEQGVIRAALEQLNDSIIITKKGI